VKKNGEIIDANPSVFFDVSREKKPMPGGTGSKIFRLWQGQFGEEEVLGLGSKKTKVCKTCNTVVVTEKTNE